jgi:uncharacterized lipoprotein YmbA
MRISIFASLSLVGLLAACSSPAPDPTLYLLRPEPGEGSARIDSPTRAGLGRLIVAPYLLASQGIVVETAAGEVRAARLHQWAEPLQDGIRWYLRSQIGRALGYELGGALTDFADWDYAIDVFIGRLHGTMEGTAHLGAYYVIRSTSPRALHDFRFARSEPLVEEGYPALVAAERRLLDALAESIAGSLRELVEPAGEER